MTTRHSLASGRLASLLGTSLDSPGPAYASLATAIRLLLRDGRLTHGTRLPSERSLAAALGLSRTTVTAAYAQLRDDGYARSRQGSGTVLVLDSRARTPAPLGHGSDVAPDIIDLSVAAPSPADAGVGQAYAAAVDDLGYHLTGTGYLPAGLPELRESIAQRYIERGLPTSPEQVLVTTGAQAGLTLTLTTLTQPGDRVLLENPTYPNAIDAFGRFGLRPVVVGLDDDGWDSDALEAVAHQARPHVAYLIPDFHNPTSHLMGDEQRARVARALRASRTTTIIDETVAELGYDDATPPLPYAAFEPDAVLIGSAAKTYWGGLRIGWIRAPHDVMATLVQMRKLTDMSAPLLEQLVCHRLLNTPEVVAAQRTTMASRRDYLLDALAAHVPDIHARRPQGGLSLWASLPGRVSSQLAHACAAHGVRIAPGPRFAPAHGLEQHLRLPFTLAPELLSEAVVRLAAAYADVRGQANAPASPPSEQSLIA